MNIRIQLKILRLKREMSRIKSHGKIRAAAFLVGRIDGRVQTMPIMRARGRYQMPARRKPKHPDLVRIDMPLRGVEAYKPQCPLRIFQRHR